MEASTADIRVGSRAMEERDVRQVLDCASPLALLETALKSTEAVVHGCDRP